MSRLASSRVGKKIHGLAYSRLKTKLSVPTSAEYRGGGGGEGCSCEVAKWSINRERATFTTHVDDVRTTLRKCSKSEK